MLNYLIWKYDIQYNYEKYRDKLCLWLVRKLPKRLVMWCYIVVAGQSGEAPNECYIRDLNLWGVK